MDPIETRIEIVITVTGDLPPTELIRRFVYPEGPTEFNNSDPYNTELKKARYALTHDQHLALHFSRPGVRARMAAIGAVTVDGRAVCRLADFNDFRKFLFYQYMDRVHVEIKKMQEYAEDTLALRRADRAAQQRFALFVRSERENTRRERNILLRAEELAEKKRLLVCAARSFSAGEEVWNVMNSTSTNSTRPRARRGVPRQTGRVAGPLISRSPGHARLPPPPLLLLK
ncbi:hypothetical protein EVAR_62114_1 [Eumeta japonica]|uniref:Uncharacterized protein n=1 Tax=Eumeta variegata TaxID=151549 RepID=A0A4C1Z7Y2_EUMVA|nr:hypothetical protein EVAR_62114_1 [Eumeta japonica]